MRQFSKYFSHKAQSQINQMETEKKNEETRFNRIGGGRGGELMEKAVAGCS